MNDPVTEPRRNPAGPRSTPHESAAVNKASPPADNVVARIDEGVRVIAGHSEASAIKGRAHQKRKLPV
jgi:hypothetical protein